MGKKERFYVDIMATHPEVTGSCNLLIVKFPNGETTRIVVDCGMFQEKAYSDFDPDLTDDASQVKRIGGTVHITEGDYKNIKITWDLHNYVL